MLSPSFLPEDKVFAVDSGNEECSPSDVKFVEIVDSCRDTVDEIHVNVLGQTLQSTPWSDSYLTSTTADTVYANGSELVGHIDAAEGSNMPVYANSDGQSVPKVPDGDEHEWAKLFGLSLSSTVDDAVHSTGGDAVHCCVNLGIPKLSDRPMGWAVCNGSKMRDVVHLSCHSCLTNAEKRLHAANVQAFLRMRRATLFSCSEGQELVVKDV